MEKPDIGGVMYEKDLGWDCLEFKGLGVGKALSRRGLG